MNIYEKTGRHQPLSDSSSEECPEAGNLHCSELGECTALGDVLTPLVPTWLGTLPMGQSVQPHCTAPPRHHHHPISDERPLDCKFLKQNKSS